MYERKTSNAENHRARRSAKEGAHRQGFFEPHQRPLSPLLHQHPAIKTAHGWSDILPPESLPKRVSLDPTDSLERFVSELVAAETEELRAVSLFTMSKVAGSASLLDEGRRCSVVGSNQHAALWLIARGRTRRTLTSGRWSMPLVSLYGWELR